MVWPGESFSELAAVLVEFGEDLRPSPSHANLLQFANVAGTFLAERFARLPVDSGVKNFLASPTHFGWEIKRKLVWLGTKSYLFRWCFANHVSEHDEGATVGVTDDSISLRRLASSDSGTFG